MNTMDGIACTVPSALKSTAALIEGSPYPRAPTVQTVGHTRPLSCSIAHNNWCFSIRNRLHLMFPIGSSFVGVRHHSAVGIIALLCTRNLQQCVVQLHQAFHLPLPLSLLHLTSRSFRTLNRSNVPVLPVTSYILEPRFPN
jgi:hypothetical protein